MVYPQAMPDHQPDPAAKFAHHPVSTLDEVEDEDAAQWNQTIRPNDSFQKRLIAHSRDSSFEKLSQPASNSYRGAPAPNRVGYTGAPETTGKTSAYGHHRQTSIVHGVQHSPNGSLGGNAVTPISPQIAAGASSNFDRADMQPLAGIVGGRPETEITSNPRFATPLSPFSPDRASPHTESSSATNSLRKMDRLQSRSRYGHAHKNSQSSRQDQKTVGEYALHVLFTSFIAQAEEKLNDCITVPFEPEPSIERICGPGVDASFDQLITALGHIASPKPKALIDSMMLWRKSKSDAANEARHHLQQSKGTLPGGPLLRRNTEPLSVALSAPAPGTAPPNGSLHAKQEHVAHTERRSTVSIYILCRVLIEVICQSNLAAITPEMEDKLESIIFGQLKIADPEQLQVSPLKLANWNLFAQLLGHMSAVNFTGVTKRFIDDLDGSLMERQVRSPTLSSNRESDGKVELVLSGMKHLRMIVTSEESWERTCDFLVFVGRLFTRAHGQRIKTAFCQIIDMLLLRIAAQASNSYLLHPRWAEVLSVIGPRLAQLFMKPRYWSVAFPLTATLLCVSSPDNFGSQWLQLILPLQTKVKDRSSKPLCLQVISRLLWTALYRTNDSYQSQMRKIDDVIKLILPTTRRSIFATDTAVIEPLIQIIRSIGFKYPEYCFRSVIFPLMNVELFTANKELKVEQLDPDRVVIGIRAFLCIMTDLEKGEQGQPPFPRYSDFTHTDRLPTTPPLMSSLSPADNLNRQADAEIVTRPVLVHVLSDGVREYYRKFCEILGKISIVCDNTFGGQAALDEKFNANGPKTPISDTFAFRRDDHQLQTDTKQAFYELLHVAVQALPRCLSPSIPFNSLINLLCTGTAHVHWTIADSSSNSLKAIARQSHAQQVTMGFARFIFNFDDRYSTMSDGGMLGPGHIENTLRLYVELLQIWVEEIRQKMRDAATEEDQSAPAAASGRRALKLDLSSIWAEVDQAEAHGLFFLCSQSKRVRHFAITVMRLITEFDNALGKGTPSEQDSVRLIHVLENESDKVMSLEDDLLSVAERSRLQRGLQNSNSKGVLVELCTSDVSYDATLWFKIFPKLISIAYEQCPVAVAIGRDLVCNRILQVYSTITYLSEPTRGLYHGSEYGQARAGASAATQPEVVIEQWKLYLIFACTTLRDAGSTASNTSQDSQHMRKGSKPASTDEIVTARTLFKYLIPLLSVSSTSVREAVVVAMGSINVHVYRPLLEELQGQVSRCNDEARARIHQRTNSTPRRNRKMDLLRTEITHVFQLTSHLLKEPQVYHDDFFISQLTAYAKDLKLFLMDGEMQLDWEFQKLRRYYCGLLEALFDAINRTKDPTRWITFESRKSAFSLLEDWCGYSPDQNEIRAREQKMRESVINQQAFSERGPISAAMEIEKRNLRTAALSAMAALCAGPISFPTESGVTLQFDLRRMLSWIEAIFSSGSDKMNVIGRRALKNLVVHNQHIPSLLEHCIARCYLADSSKVLTSYFTVVTQILQTQNELPIPFFKILGLCLYTLGSDQSEIRSQSLGVLRQLEKYQQTNSKIQDLDISVSDKTQAVYKLAQFEISKRLANTHTTWSFHVFSEFTLYFKDLQPTEQRNIVAVLLPWVQSIELKVDSNGEPTAESFVLLANLLELTIRSSGVLHNEVQALWQALATGPHAGNVRLVLDFLMQLCLDRREQNFVEYVKQIVVFLSTTSASPGIKVLEFLLIQITPKAMVPNEKKDVLPPPADVTQFPYCADLGEALPIGTKQAGFSLGQLCLILLVDLIVSPVQVTPESVPLLLQVVMILWDHYTPMVQEQAREMLVHLVHELVLSQMADETEQPSKQELQDLLDLVRRHDRSVVWSYEDSNGKVDEQENKVPLSMEYLTGQILYTFELAFPGVKEEWGRLALTWATSCPVRHLACRSFQIFRCVFTSIDVCMLADMLARLSNTIADEDVEIQSFAMEILTTLKTLIVKLPAEQLLSFPQLFWTTCACLESINEREFLEAIEMLEELLLKIDFRSPASRQALAEGQPERWDEEFQGIQMLLHKGLRSSVCLQPTFDVMDHVLQQPTGPLIGDDSRLFYGLLANFPRFLNELEAGGVSEQAQESARILLGESDRQGLETIAVTLDALVSGEYQHSPEFLDHFLASIREYYLPRMDFHMVVFLIGLLTNSLSWVKVQTMRILCEALPGVDMRNPELAGHGSDLISPLLRLLQTEFCMQALEVLDRIMIMSGNHMDKHHLRMSMTRSTSRAIRKEYESTESLFGIPEASGWAIAVPAKRTEITRANIHAAFYTCQNSEDGLSLDETPTADVEFHAEDVPYGYFENQDRTETMLSDDGRAEMGVTDLVTKLDNLDDFFDEPGSPQNDDDGNSSRTITEFSPESFESGTQLYDEQILPILHQASNNNSFQNGFTDRLASARDPVTNNHSVLKQAAPTMRPALHSRSITSPSAPASYQPQMGEAISDEEWVSQGMSDVEESPVTAHPAAAGETPFTFEKVVPPDPKQGGTTRRLASRSRDERHRAPPPQVSRTTTNMFPGPGLPDML